MFGWTRRATELTGQGGSQVAATPGALVHDIVHVQVLGLLVTDTFRWKRDWAAWRIRFAYSNEHAGQSFRDVS